MKNVTFISTGAGSGKTYTLTQKIVEMVRNGECRSDEIILTTFTKSAANELREKVRSALYAAGFYDAAMNIDNAAIVTIYSLAYQFVSRYWHLLGISANVTIMSMEDCNFYVSQSLSLLPTEDDMLLFDRISKAFDVKKYDGTKKQNVLNPDFWKEELKNVIDKTMELCISEDQLEKAKEDSKKLLEETIRWNDDIVEKLPCSKHVRVLIEEYIDKIFYLAKQWKSSYEEFKRERCLLDNGDLLQKFHELLNKDEVANDIKSRYKVALVDEFEDYSPLQIKSFKLLSELMEQSVWVGDIRQSIYGFCGSNPELVKAVIGEIKKGENGNKFESLKYCWRSSETIVNMVNDVFVKLFDGQIDANLVKLGIPVGRENPPKEQNLRHWNFEDVKREERKKMFVDELEKFIEETRYSYKDIAILYRGINDVIDCAAELKTRGIPYNVKLNNNAKDGLDDISAASDENGITVMTCHQSKGLEWPCVILCSFNKKVLDKKNGFYGVLTLNTAEETLLRLVPVALKKVIEIDEENHEFFSHLREVPSNEAKRLLYVGMTRPKEQLILVTEGKADECDLWVKNKKV